jgi:hypothetical protein
MPNESGGLATEKHYMTKDRQTRNEVRERDGWQQLLDLDVEQNFNDTRFTRDISVHENPAWDELAIDLRPLLIG